MDDVYFLFSVLAYLRIYESEKNEASSTLSSAAFEYFHLLTRLFSTFGFPTESAQQNALKFFHFYQASNYVCIFFAQFDCIIAKFQTLFLPLKTVTSFAKML